MSIYIVSRVTINNPDEMALYMAAAPATVEQYGGTYLARTSDFEALEGEADCDRMVVLSFPTKADAMAWYNSKEYRPLRDQRWNSADAQIVLINA
ncbi:DUF1330 domain-containing protein [Maritalea sp.]|jgi:uncharacterized protein (DUF1330 family)|uniref:DUF1330 domain-containing protein n=1 Tax=Maritalea sp. TaxID=2003361 RepID=UPI0039E4E504